MKIFYSLLALSITAYADTDHTQMPSGVTANVTQKQLCVSGYTTTVRPPADKTNKIKELWTPAGHKPSEYELDHYIPIELGGSPTDENNLWMQPIDEARRKDVQETLLHRDMCYGIYTLQQAQNSIRKWK